MRITLLIIAILTLIQPTEARSTGINAPFEGRKNPFLQALGLATYRISLSRDSTRIDLSDGHMDVILMKKKLWNISRYDRDGTLVDIGSFRDGAGVVRLTFGRETREAELRNGALDGKVLFIANDRGGPRTKQEYLFRDGLLHGESRSWSFWAPRYVSVIRTYQEGYLIQADNYGRMRRWGYPFLSRVVDPTFLCSRTIYEKGKLISRTCNVPRCRTCGM